MATYFAHSINQVDKDGANAGDCLTCVLANPDDKAAILQAIRDNLQTMNGMRDAQIAAATTEAQASAQAAKEQELAQLTSERDALAAQVAELTKEPDAAVVTQRQFRLALLAGGIRAADIEAIIAQIPDATAREAAEIEWNWASVIARTNPLVAQLGGLLGKTDAEIDQLFAIAASL